MCTYKINIFVYVRTYVYVLYVCGCIWYVRMLVDTQIPNIFTRQRVEREEREELRKKGVPNWKEKSYMPEELAGKLEQDRRTFQIKAVEVNTFMHISPVAPLDTISCVCMKGLHNLDITYVRITFLTVQYMVRVLDVRYKRGIEFADHLLQYMGVQRG